MKIEGAVTAMISEYPFKFGIFDFVSLVTNKQFV